MFSKNIVKRLFVFIFVFMFLIPNGYAREYEIWQKNKQFRYQELIIEAGDTISFPNRDPYYHNIFSLSENKLFDLGSYPQGQTRKVTFELPGVYYVECAIHSHMQLVITVK